MRTNDSGFNLIKEFEGCKLEAYYDMVGVLTIGYGHTGGDVYLGLTITPERASNLLYTDIMDFEAFVSRLIKTTVNDNQFSALVSFAYNLGTKALAESTLLKKLNAGDFQGAADQFLVWNKAGGKVVPGLTARREAERALFLKTVA